jgi:hypothetical protein
MKTYQYRVVSCANIDSAVEQLNEADYDEDPTVKVLEEALNRLGDQGYRFMGPVPNYSNHYLFEREAQRQ